LIREYTTPGGGKVREVGPMIYGYSMTVGPDGKPIFEAARLPLSPLKFVVYFKDYFVIQSINIAF
jgi:HSP20 family protein